MDEYEDWEEVRPSSEGTFITWKVFGQRVVGVWVEQFIGKHEDRPVGVVHGNYYSGDVADSDLRDHKIKFSMTVQLVDKLKDAKPKDKVDITYISDERSDSGQMYKNFRVLHARRKRPITVET